MLLPVLGSAREAAKSAQCKSNMHQIGLAMQMYRNDNHDCFYCYLNADGTVHYTSDYNNYGLWDFPPPNSTQRLPSSYYTYWAVAYVPYISSAAANYAGTDGASLFKGVRSLWSCPSSGLTDPTSYGSSLPWTQANSPSTIALSWFVWGRKAGMFNNPTALIVAEDSPEQTIEGNGDLLCPFYLKSGVTDDLNALVWEDDTNKQNLSQWANQGQEYYYPQAIHEYFRHNNATNCLRLDGHVDVVQYTRGTGVPYSWYSGQYGVYQPN
jgi:prepilin-type processing-associated H-X9-DG protein